MNCIVSSFSTNGWARMRWNGWLDTGSSPGAPELAMARMRRRATRRRRSRASVWLPVEAWEPTPVPGMEPRSPPDAPPCMEAKPRRRMERLSRVRVRVGSYGSPS